MQGLPLSPGVCLAFARSLSSLSLPGSEDEEEYGHDDEYLPELGALLAQEMRTCTSPVCRAWDEQWESF